ncbi:hypothetical protein [Sulfurospirillum arsenophilum]|uniref:hypothetical protein n=1 Tax=Sulfurospirillum arsenophilum TaxID=56698 RepID=UPI0005AABB0F|nr:hypothetical protein [Sulfurospirillum arsenophilum]
MFHKENNTLDLLGQFSQNNTPAFNKQNDEENPLRELGQFMTRADKKDDNRTFGIPNFLWYLVMIAMFGYLLRELYFLNQIDTSPESISTINKAISKETNKMKQEVLEMQQMTNKAFQNANTKEEQK